MNVKFFFPALLFFAAVPAGPVHAQENVSSAMEHVLVVTPSRRPESLEETIAAVSVITREDIEVSAAPDLAELLRTLPGIDVVRSGGPGSQVSIFMRGSNSNHVLVLIDGIRASSSNTGSYVWEQLPLNQIERVEVVRGPAGSLYGSDSIGGVIHVITRSSAEPYARITAGSYETREIEAGIGYEGERAQVSINAAWRDVGGFSAQNENGFAYDPDDDGFTSANLGVKGSVQSGEGKWTFSLLALDNEAEFDQGISATNQAIAAAGYEGRISSAWSHQLLAGYSGEELTTDHGFYRTGFDSGRLQLSWQHQLTAGPNDVFGFGLDWYDENGKSQGSWNEKRRNAGLFATWDHSRGPLNLQIGGRWDDNSEFSGQFTGQAALAYALNDHWEIMAGYGTAFRGPNLNEQFSPGFSGLFAGNPDLDPESSNSAEAGVRWRHSSAGSLEISLYRTEVDDLISFSGPAFQAINIDRARLQGIEAAYGYAAGPWAVSASATLQDTEDLTTGAALLRRPKQKAAFSIDRHFANGSWLGIEWVYTGDRADFGGIGLDAYHLLNLRGGWQARPDWRLELRGENLADEDYEPIYGYNAPGRSWFISLAWTP
ncbi:MAG: TonB-dependent receptor [Xanthomonadales bacterium]|nr:TonB-dependent receptor [Xanthomonadales bacterium]